jgi:tetratricopeptide (TPR) repeat protein
MAEIDQLYKRAEEAFQKRNYDYARDLFMQILLVHDPDHIQARKALHATIVKKLSEQGAPGWLKQKALRAQTDAMLMATKDPKKRMETCQKHLNDDPTHFKIRTLLAQSLLELSHVNGAMVESQLAIESDPKNVNVPAMKILVMACTKLGKVKEAQDALAKVAGQVKEDRDLEKLQRDLAAMQTMKAGFEDAATAGKDGFRSAMKDAAHAEELEKKQHLITSEADLVAVIQKLENDLAENPTDPKIPKRLGDLYAEKRHDYKSAQDWYKKAVQLAPQDSALKDKVEDCSLRLQQIAIEAAAKANDPRLAELKTALLKLRIQVFERRVADRPTDMGLRLDLGKAYYAGGAALAGPNFLDRAISEFQQAVKDPKKKTDGHYALGLAFTQKGLYDMADKQFGLSEESTLVQTTKLDIMYARAKANASGGNFQRAVDVGTKIIEIDIAYKDISALVEKWQKGEK